MTLQAIDGRKRGQVLRDANGKFTTRTKYIDELQEKIKSYYSKNKVYHKYLDQNPDLKVLMGKNQAEIEALEKEINLVNNSKRGIKDRVKLYRQALESQNTGMTAQQIDEQVARYKDGLLAKRKERFNELKGKNEARLRANQKPQIQQQGKFAKCMKKFGKFGAIGLGIAALVGGGIALFSSKGENVSVEQPVLHDTVPTKTVIQPSKQEADSVEYETFEANKGDNYWKYGDLETRSQHIGEDYKPTNSETNTQMREIMNRNNVDFAKDNYHSSPILKIGDEVQLSSSCRKYIENELIKEHKGDSNYKPTKKEVLEKFKQMV